MVLWAFNFVIVSTWTACRPHTIGYLCSFMSILQDIRAVLRIIVPYESEYLCCVFCNMLAYAFVLICQYGVQGVNACRTILVWNILNIWTWCRPSIVFLTLFNLFRHADAMCAHAMGTRTIAAVSSRISNILYILSLDMYSACNFLDHDFINTISLQHRRCKYYHTLCIYNRNSKNLVLWISYSVFEFFL